ncbi:hypothetical protein BP00DRAFT_6576 [Aspergillus indologenus CBS 114.80]|uniref:Uncharacterized protein n=1 Tax=Aspergillus indologenus CBS 114.80 TaxID=1450541 RepID=A0A2V5JCX0_9EURO|nr:hypothetical protein BP00DRAFT_6576 [Aspergillus indologenus CBS 114.80]
MGLLCLCAKVYRPTAHLTVIIHGYAHAGVVYGASTWFVEGEDGCSCRACFPVIDELTYCQLGDCPLEVHICRRATWASRDTSSAIPVWELRMTFSNGRSLYIVTDKPLVAEIATGNEPLIGCGRRGSEANKRMGQPGLEGAQISGLTSQGRKPILGRRPLVIGCWRVRRRADCTSAV